MSFLLTDSSLNSWSHICTRYSVLLGYFYPLMAAHFPLSKVRLCHNFPTAHLYSEMQPTLCAPIFLMPAFVRDERAGFHQSQDLGTCSPACAFATPGLSSCSIPPFHQFILLNLIIPTSVNTFSWFLPLDPAIFLGSSLEKNIPEGLTEVVVSICSSFLCFLSPLQWVFIPIPLKLCYIRSATTYVLSNGHLIIRVLLGSS